MSNKQLEIHMSVHRSAYIFGHNIKPHVNLCSLIPSRQANTWGIRVKYNFLINYKLKLKQLFRSSNNTDLDIFNDLRIKFAVEIMILMPFSGLRSKEINIPGKKKQVNKFMQQNHHNSFQTTTGQFLNSVPVLSGMDTFHHKLQ